MTATSGGRSGDTTSPASYLEAGSAAFTAAPVHCWRGRSSMRIPTTTTSLVQPRRPPTTLAQKSTPCSRTERFDRSAAPAAAHSLVSVSNSRWRTLVHLLRESCRSTALPGRRRSLHRVFEEAWCRRTTTNWGRDLLPKPGRKRIVAGRRLEPGRKRIVPSRAGTSGHSERTGFRFGRGDSLLLQRLLRRRRHTVTIVTEPLHSLLEKVTGKPKNTVDFWSLDVEGSEAGILQNTDFSKVEVGVMLIEMNKTPENNATIKKIMREKGFRDVGTSKYNEGRGVEALDHVFVNDEYFRRRNVKPPNTSEGPMLASFVGTPGAGPESGNCQSDGATPVQLPPNNGARWKSVQGAAARRSPPLTPVSLALAAIFLPLGSVR